MLILSSKQIVSQLGSAQAGHPFRRLPIRDAWIVEPRGHQHVRTYTAGRTLSYGE